MSGNRPRSWQERYDAAGPDPAVETENARRYFGGPVRLFLVRQLPGSAALFLLGLFLQGWLWGAVMAAFALVSVLVIRAWARRHYGIPTRRPPDS